MKLLTIWLSPPDGDVSSCGFYSADAAPEGFLVVNGLSDLPPVCTGAGVA